MGSILGSGRVSGWGGAVARPIVALLLTSACGGADDGSTSTPFLVSAPTVGPAVSEREFAAELRAARHAELRARMDGVVEAALVDDGERVQAGDPLFAVNAQTLDRELEVALAQVRGAVADLDAARLDRDNTRVLVDRAVVSPVELALAESRVNAQAAASDEARAAAELARVRRDLAVIRAPFDGVVNLLPRKVGSAVAAGDLLTTISDPSEILAWFHLSEREALAWETQDERPPEVALLLADGSVYPHPGQVDAVAGEFDPETGNLAVRVRFPNPEGRLRHGGTGTVRLLEVIPDAVRVPQRSTVDVQGSYFVYVVDDSGIPRTRRVVPRSRVGDDFVLAEGLSASDRFVVEGVQKIRDGEKIDTRDVSAGG
jgi:membrane fusion protein (multidrug efflux system)